MRICVLITNNHIGGGTKLALRLAQYLSEYHDVVAYYPIVPYYYVTTRLSSPGFRSKARYVLASVRRSLPAVAQNKARNKSRLLPPPLRRWLLSRLSRDRYSRIHFDEPGFRLRYEWYLTYPSRKFLADFDVVIYLSPWSFHEIKDLDLPNVKKVFWCVADYLHIAIHSPINLILEAYNASDQLVASSEFIRRNLAVSGATVHGLVHAAVDEVFFLPQKPEPRESVSVLGYFFQNSEVKGAPTLLKVLLMLREKYPDLTIELLGPSDSGIASQAPSICNRYHTNLTPAELSRLYRKHSIFLYPSYTDGFQAPPLEAMASGCSVVATSIGAIPDYAAHEHNALICPPMNADAMFECADRLLQDSVLRDKLARNAASDARKWNWQSAAEKFDALLKANVR